MHTAHLILFWQKFQARAPALVALPKSTLVERGRHPLGPCSRGPVSAKWVPARLAEGSRGGSGRETGTPLPKGSCRCIQSLSRLSPCSLLSLLCMLHGGAVRPALCSALSAPMHDVSHGVYTSAAISSHSLPFSLSPGNHLCLSKVDHPGLRAP